MKNKYVNIFLLLCFLFSQIASAKSSNKRRQKPAELQLKSALRRVNQMKDYASASRSLFLLLNNPDLEDKKDTINYHLALSFYNMEFYQPALIYFKKLINSSSRNYRARSLQRIALIAVHLQDDKQLQYSIKNRSLKYTPKSQRPKMHYYYGEYWMRKKKYKRALTHFSRVPSSHALSYKALYQSALAYAELGQADKASRTFSRLESRRAESSVTDSLKVSALMGRARSYYQAGKWPEASQAYYEVPKDSPFWHDTLLERSWAFLRGGKLRSALGNFQTLHSPYYVDYYQPESLLLRAIVYLYICKYFEMGKVLDLFKNSYYPVFSQVNDLIKGRHSQKAHYQSLVLSLSDQKRYKTVDYPKVISRRILREAGFSAQHHYINRLKDQRDAVYRQAGFWRRSKAGRYTLALINRQLNRAQIQGGKQALRQLRVIRRELKDFFNQEKYLRYELLRSKRGFLKKKIAEKTTGKVSIEYFDRSFYIQNGYEYWPFRGGEYWLDELGNYHYVGMDSCK